MANPTLLTMPLCVNADKNTIPPTDSGTSGLFSEELGFQDINSLPLASGGKAPNRRDFNGVFALLGGIAYECQRGFTFLWSATLDYVAGCIVIDSTDGKRYECIADVSAGGSVPSADTTHWEEFVTDTTALANTDLSNLTAMGLNAFASKTLSNLDTNNLSVHVVVDSYYDDTTGNWYRVYDDGWIEQGGLFVGSGGYFIETVTLLKPMADAKYFIGLTNYVYNSSGFAPTADNATTTSFRASNVVGANSARWFVAGKGASV